MTNLTDAPVLRIEQRSSQLEYLISDGTGAELGRAVQVAGPAPRKGLLGLAGSGLGDARVVLQVSGTDGAPLFYVDRKGGCPVAIVGSGGDVIGRFVGDVAGTSRAKVDSSRFGLPGAGLVHRLWDARDRPVGEVAWKVKTAQAATALEVLGGVCVDMDGTRTAEIEVQERKFKDRYTLRIPPGLPGPPEPLRTLVRAVPLALDLTRS
ncbi:hypothetical protein [Spirillospora sp. NPDC029432]|uniref:hypothetical protein n=1 Tax=Spirillospora sp. NPDC029432 TaxID=3154599 RepID=UPI003452A3D4